ncbi:SDR family NAD(P)-dependent oxidoreductase [Lysobacter soli]|uniref:SDR family NAD(P)-dependent oxidoreductase n=1 Tax=Lysobacter soli TaxID=453783 RepID=UPI00240FF6F3|nr:SDR family NAD(P)-dependent oxidoreductase [Lysobacter soli]MDG2518631.1 SDR family NAD(P)-dependent oxidoreductase [Lysobacter soli]
MRRQPDHVAEAAVPVEESGRSDARTWFITGASSGLGRALAETVLARGDRAVLAARGVDRFRDLVSAFPARALAVAMDVTDRAQRAAAVDQALAHFGRIDVLVNNAGIDFLGAIEEQREDDYRAQFEVNFFGPVEMIRLVLPGMRARGKGTIVNMSSMDGLSSLPANGYYSSSKFALEGLTEALWQELEPLGLRAFLVEPGSFRTGIEQRTKFSGESIAAYAATSGAFRDLMGTLTPDMFPGDPARAAEAIFEVVASQPDRHWVVLGSDAQRRIQAKLTLLQAEVDAGEAMALSTDYPGSASAVL